MPQKTKNTKYIFISGGVLSSLGKGITTASIAMLLQAKEYKVTIVKCENYLNIDAGLINPIEHGDTFLCEDGTEADMDIGNYERFIEHDLGKHSFITMGQIYKTVIDRERNFGYGGEDVEAIPHVTDEIISRIKQAAEKDNAEICIVELGGTVGEYQNVLYYEASRIMKLSLQDTVAHVHISYLPTPAHIGEPKTKPTQLSVKQLNSMGIQPDFLVVRGQKPLDDRRREKLALFSSLKSERVINNQNVENIYEIPLILHNQDFDSKLLKLLGLKNRKSDLKTWKDMVKKIKTPKKQEITIAIVGKYFRTGDYSLEDSYAALIEALKHSATWLELGIKLKHLDSEELERKGTSTLRNIDGIVVPIGWGSRGTEGKIKAIKHARENKIPFLGLCYGMQLAVVEFARNVAGLKEANSEEINPDTPYPVIHIIPEQKRNLKKRAYGGTMRLGGWDCKLDQDSLTYSIYSKHNALTNKNMLSERHRHRYEFNDDYAKQLTEKGLVIAGRSFEENLVEFIELPKRKHPFFVGTQGHPEYKSRPLHPHPLFLEFLKSSLKNKK